MQNELNLSAEAIRAITALQHKNGTFRYYKHTINRLKILILHQSDEIGMSDAEALHSLRVLDAIGCDLAALAGSTANETSQDANAEEVAGRVEQSFEGLTNLDEADDIHDSNHPVSDMNHDKSPNAKP